MGNLVVEFRGIVEKNNEEGKLLFNGVKLDVFLKINVCNIVYMYFFFFNVLCKGNLFLLLKFWVLFFLCDCLVCKYCLRWSSLYFGIGLMYDIFLCNLKDCLFLEFLKYDF